MKTHLIEIKLLKIPRSFGNMKGVNLVMQKINRRDERAKQPYLGCIMRLYRSYKLLSCKLQFEDLLIKMNLEYDKNYIS